MISYMTDESDWKDALDTGVTLNLLRANVGAWEPFVPDALAVVAGMDDAAWQRWRAGLAVERRGEFGGEDFAREFGALLLPAQLLRASQVAFHAHVPLGCALTRMQEVTP